MDLNLAIIGAVVIGRNEGQRLVNCLQSIKGQISHIVYVDSGSTDDSLNTARQLGVLTVSLDMSVPFTAARARNIGAAFLLEQYPETKYFQFIDGDCGLQNDWINNAYKFLETHKEYAVACGRRRERFPTQSIYNKLCDIEWDTPVGDALACGGDALFRVDAFQKVEGFNSELIAGEEPELCFRLRQHGWKVRRLDAAMTLHDAAMNKFTQWWRRAKRAGYAYAASFSLHGSAPEKFRKREVISIIVWAGIMPLTIFSFVYINTYFIWSLLLYVIPFVRIVLRSMVKMRYKDAQVYSFFTLLAKFPQLIGLITFYINRVTRKKQHIIEYK